MRLTQKKIEEIIVGILGEGGTPLVKELYAKENVSEFDLASRTKSDIKVIRKLLYILYNHNLVGFTRKKDKIKGWYVYYWTLLPESVRYSYIKRKRELKTLLEQRLEEEKKELFFSCPTHCVRLNFDQAVNFEFHCPECGELAQQEDSQDRIADIKKRIAELDLEIEAAIEKKKVVRKEGKERKKIVRKKKKKIAKNTKKK